MRKAVLGHCMDLPRVVKELEAEDLGEAGRCHASTYGDLEDGHVFEVKTLIRRVKRGRPE